MGKTFKNLFPQIYGFQHLLAAFKRARRGKGDREYVAAFEYALEDNLLRLEDELRAETYRPGGYRSYYIYEPKKRLISAAPFRDRVVHHALAGALEPIWEARFVHDSYACRKGKGIHQAVDRAHGLLRNHRYALKGDVVKFFPNVDHEVLLGLLARHVADPPVLRLAGRILAGGAGVLDGEAEPAWFPGDDLFAALRPRGLPIGNLTSQFWASVYLNELDQFVKRELRVRAYLRYADDILLFGDDKAQLWAWRDAIGEFLAGLRLRLHERKTVVFPVRDGVDWLGFRLYPGYRRLRRANVRRAYRRLKRQQAAYARGQLDAGSLTRSVQSWVAHARFADTRALRRRVLGAFVFGHG